MARYGVKSGLLWLFVVLGFSVSFCKIAAKKNTAKKACIQNKKASTKKAKASAKRLAKKRSALHEVQRVQDCQTLPIDIPLPLGSRSCKGGTRSHPSGAAGLPMKVRYMSTQPASAVVVFYEAEMERLGWQKIASYQFDNEHTLFFNKPDRIVLICLYGSKKTPEMTITVGSKEPAALL